MIEFILLCPCCMQYETSDEHLKRCALGEAKTRIANLVKEVERLTSCLQYEQHRATHMGTHGPGCWSWGPRHYECAMGEIEALRADAERYRYLRQAKCLWEYEELHRSSEELDAAIDAARGERT